MSSSSLPATVDPFLITHDARVPVPSPSTDSTAVQPGAMLRAEVAR
jgi:hypothetical protein